MLTLGADQATGELVTLDQAARLQGLYLAGLSGTGKSTLLLNMVSQDMEAGHGLCVFDPHGDLIREVGFRIPQSRADEVILLDPLNYHQPFGLHLFQCSDPTNPIIATQTQERVLHVFEKVWYPEGDMMQSAPQLVEVLSNLTYLLISNQDYTMAEIPRILSNQPYRAPLINNIHNQYARQWWITKYNRMVQRDKDDYTSSTVRRIDRFLQNPILLNIVGQNRTSVNLRQVMDQGKILLVRLPVASIGEDAVTLLGSILISQLLNAALSREDIPDAHNRRFFALYADEYHRFAIADFASLLAEARKFGVATTVAHQYLAQLDSINRAAVKSTVNKVVFQVNPDDGRELSGGFYHEPEKGEITGYRPIIGISRTPYDDLLRRGHSDTYVNDLVKKSLLILDTTMKKHSDSAFRIHYEIFKPVKYHVTSTKVLEQQSRQINEFLVSMMERRISPTTDNETREICRSMSDYIAGKYCSSNEWDDYQKNILELQTINGVARDWDSSVSFEHFFEDEIIGSIRLLGRYLYDNPLMVNTAVMEPIYDRPRAYADVQAEVASKLAHLPNREAKVRLIQDQEVREYNLVTNPPPPPGEVPQLCNESYTRPRAEVEAEIARRQDPPSTTPRRHVE